jgi:Putative lumazine-binding
MSTPGTAQESLVDDYDAIRTVVQLCLDGEVTGNVATLQEAFHPDARMFGDVATATAAEEGYWGAVSFVACLSLCRIEGSWKIVNKTFAHRGGEPPA